MSNLSSQIGLHGTKSYQMGAHGLVCISLGILEMGKEKDCSATVGVDPLMTQVFDLSTLKLSLQLQQLPPKGHSWSLSSFRLMTGCYSSS